MLRRPINLKPLNVDQRIGKTRIDSRGRTAEKEDNFSLPRIVRRRPGVPSSCVATVGSDTIEHPSQVDVKNIKTALAIVHGYDSLKKLKVPRIPEKIPDRILFSGSPLKVSTTTRPFDRYRENSPRQTSTQNEKKQLNVAKKTSSVGKCDPNFVKEKERPRRRQNKKGHMQKKVKKLNTTPESSKPSDMQIPDVKWLNSDTISGVYASSRPQNILHSPHLRTSPLGFHWSQTSTPTIFGRLGLGHLTPIAENSEEEVGEREHGESMEKLRPPTSPPPERAKMPVSRSQPSTQQVHEWMQKSSHKVLSSKESHKPSRTPRHREKTSKMVECASGVIGLTECASSKKRYKRTGGRGKHTIRNEPTKSKVLMEAIGRQGVCQTRKMGKNQLKNSKTTLTRHTKEVSWVPVNMEDKKAALKKIIAYDSTKGSELPVPASKKLHGEYIRCSNKLKRNPSLPKPSKPNVQRWVSKSNAVVTSNTVRPGCHYANKRMSKSKGKLNISNPGDKSLPKSWSNEDPPKKKSIGDLLNSWIMQLTY